MNASTLARMDSKGQYREDLVVRNYGAHYLLIHFYLLLITIYLFLFTIFLFVIPTTNKI